MLMFFNKLSAKLGGYQKHTIAVARAKTYRFSLKSLTVSKQNCLEIGA